MTTFGWCFHDLPMPTVSPFSLIHPFLDMMQQTPPLGRPAAGYRLPLPRRWSVRQESRPPLVYDARGKDNASPGETTNTGPTLQEPDRMRERRERLLSIRARAGVSRKDVRDDIVHGTRDGTAESNSRDQTLRRQRGKGKFRFPCSADHKQDWQPYQIDVQSAESNGRGDVQLKRSFSNGINNATLLQLPRTWAFKYEWDIVSAYMCVCLESLKKLIYPLYTHDHFTVCRRFAISTINPLLHL